MSERNSQGYRNPAYKHEEAGHQSHDTRSASSTSSVKRFLHVKLKSGSKARWVVLVVVILILILIIAAICATVFVLKTENKETKLQQVNGDQSDKDSRSTTMATKTSGTTRLITSPKSTPSGRSTLKPATTTRTSSRPPTTTTPFVDNSTPKNSSVLISDIDFYLGAQRLTVSCQVFHKGDLRSVAIRRQFKDGYEPIATAVKVSDTETEVVVFPGSVTYKKVERRYEMLLSVTFDPFDCTDLTNFSCALLTDVDTVADTAHITINNDPPVMEIPHSVVEDRNISLECVVTLWGNDSSLLWKFKPDQSNMFMIFNVEPAVNVTYEDCLATITSTLTFSPTMYEHGAEFRCQIDSPYNDSRMLRDSDYAGVDLQVVPKTFCDDKRHFTINKHPYEPCSLVVYCLNTGPQVYEIECEPGQCYDANTTKCVDASIFNSTSSFSSGS